MKIEINQVNRKERPGMNGNQYRQLFAKPRIYVWPKGETIIEQLETRRDRPHSYWRTYVLPHVFRALDFNPDVCAVRWSQKAGCDCGCSPGFVMIHSDVDPNNTGHAFDIHVTVEDDPPTVEVTESTRTDW